MMIMRRLRFRSSPSLRDDHRGQALVEFALVVPLLLILVIGVFEFGRAWNAYQVVTDAAREGARLAVVDNNSDDESAVIAAIEQALERANLRATPVIEIEGCRMCDPGPQPPLPGATSVSISYPYSFNFLGPLLRWTTGQQHIALRTSFDMRNER